MNLFKECISNKEMTRMKQGLISLIPKPNKDSLYVEDWGLFTPVILDYKLFELMFARCLKKFSQILWNHSSNSASSLHLHKQHKHFQGPRKNNINICKIKSINKCLKAKNSILFILF